MVLPKTVHNFLNSFAQNRQELELQMVWAKLIGIADGLTQTVHNPD